MDENDQTKPPPKVSKGAEHGAKVSAAYAIRGEHRMNMATKRAQIVNEQKRFVEMVTKEEWEHILDLIESGGIAKTVMESLGYHTSTLNRKCGRDPEFAARYEEALIRGYDALGQDIRNVTRGVPGYSTGDVQRDALVAKYDLELARAFSRKRFGQHQRIEVENVTPTVILAPVPALPPIDEAEFSDVEDDGEE